MVSCPRVPPRFSSILATSVLLSSCGHVGLDLQEPEHDGPSKPSLGGAGAGDTLPGSTAGDGDNKGDGGDPADEGTGGFGETGGLNGAGGSNGTGGSAGDPDTSTGGTSMTEPLFAEDFEDDILGTVTTDGGSTLMLTNELSHSGDGALVTTQGGPGVGAALWYNLTPRLDGDLYVRGWVYIPQDTVNGRVKLVGFRNWNVLFDVNVAGAGRVDVYVQDTGERSTSRQDAYRYDEWFCLQAHYHADSTKGFVEAFINEESVARINPQDTRGGTGVRSIDIGLSWTELNQTGAVVYWDDVTIDTKPVACGL